jgi:hypothetical protein
MDTLELREHVHHEVDQLTEPDLLELAQVVERLRQKTPRYDMEAFKANVANVRHALRNVKGNLSDDIIADREDRIVRLLGYQVFDPTI